MLVWKTDMTIVVLSMLENLNTSLWMQQLVIIELSDFYKSYTNKP